MKKRYAMMAVLALAGCAGLNPNPGERTFDIAWHNYDYPRAFAILKPAAERGEPWAQLRMGVAYELGAGVPKDIPTAIRWYSLAAAQEAEGGWADGLVVGAVGKLGYFNANSAALVAKYQMANLYLNGEGVPRDVQQAYALAQDVSDKSAGRRVYYCCEHIGARYIRAIDISDTLARAKAALAGGGGDSPQRPPPAS